MANMPSPAAQGRMPNLISGPASTTRIAAAMLARAMRWVHFPGLPVAIINFL